MSSSIDKEIFSAGIRFNQITGEISVPGANKGEVIRLSPVNRRVLSALINAQGNAVSRADLFDQVWPNQEISDDALTRSISDLRAQLKPLANTNPLITTIPKVGYRWLPDTESPSALKQPETRLKQHLIPILTALMLLLLLTAILLYLLINSAQKDHLGIIILPAQNDGGLNVATCLKQASNDNGSIRYLSDHAFSAHRGNPYPYFSHEFGVRWFIESNVVLVEELRTLNFNLVDAKTGLVVLSKTYGLNKNEALSNQCRSFINTITLSD